VLALATAAGLLTHYDFVIVATGGTVLGAVRLLPDGRLRRLSALIAAQLGGALLFVALHPHTSRRRFVPSRRARTASPTRSSCSELQGADNAV
jgi:hypothetical protein